jgi:hypothetical protein
MKGCVAFLNILKKRSLVYEMYEDGYDKYKFRSTLEVISEHK